MNEPHTLPADAVCGRLAALCETGPAGRVHSVFGRALNMAAGGEFATLLSAGRALSPFSARLFAPFDFAAAGALPGMPVSLSPAGICVPGAGLCVSFGGAKRANLACPAPGGLRPPGGAPQARLAALALAIAAGGAAADGIAPVLSELFAPAIFPPRLAPNVYSRFFAPRAARLWPALQRADVRACAALAPGLWGCGPGLTPSSDDFLSGVFAALHAAAAAGLMGRETAHLLCAALAAPAAEATNFISAQLAAHAAGGLFSEDVLAVLSAFFSPTPAETITPQAEKVLLYGSTSGADTLAGLWFAAASLLVPATSIQHPTGGTQP